MKVWIWLLLVFLSSPLLAAQLQVEAGSAEVGKPLTVKIILHNPPKDKIPPPLYPSSAIANFLWLGGEEIAVPPGQLGWQYHLLPQMAGEFELPPLALRVEGELIQSAPLLIQVQPASHPPQPPEFEPPLARGFRWSLLLGSLALAIGAWFWLAPAAPAPTENISPSLTPGEQALAALAQLERESPAAGQFFEELSHILRAYMEAEYHLPALEQTSYEFAISLQQTWAILPEEQKELQEFFKLADFVKFARFQPQLEACREALQGVRHFIRIRGGHHAD